MLDTTMLTAIDAWLSQDPDPATYAELTQLRDSALAGDSAAVASLAAAFAGPLEFGTAGLRGPLGPGPARMNRVVVTQAAAGFAQWLRNQGLHSVAGKPGKVIIGYDARYNSDIFARDTAEIMAGAGFEPLLTKMHTPTPVVAFGIKHFGCVAGIVVTASHNPPQDNGYKVYLGDGSQIIPPVDGEIAANIAAFAERPISEIPRSVDITMVGDELVAAYLERAVTLVDQQNPRQLSWVYTAMHGVGARVMDRVANAIGFPDSIPVVEQIEPDPDFPTVAFPNPEEPGAIDLALALAKHHDADVVIANDPDADRCAVAIPIDGSWRMLRGDELGSLLGDDALRRGVTGTYANSIVSSTQLQAMAKANNVPFCSTLTGFKWIGRVPNLAFGYEEAIGYCVDSAAVPDKDGITAAARVLAIAAELKAAGETLADRLAEISHTYGLFATDQLSVRVEDLSIISDAMAQLRSHPPKKLLGEPVIVKDLSRPDNDLPATNGMEFSSDRIHVVVRPSGTEPKLKCYLEYRQTPQESADLAVAQQRATEALLQLRRELSSALGL